jgi:molybdopterin-containing oxidoreductase family iron-sulfur binding subunit
MPVVIQPGMAENTIQIDLGYGREEAGVIGSGAGFDASMLMNAESMITPWIFTGAGISAKTLMDKETVRDPNTLLGDPYILSPKQFRLASTQEHHQLDDTLGDGLAQSVSQAANSGKEYELSKFDKVRNIIQESTVEEFKHGHTHLHKHDTKSIMANHEYKGIKWAMAIDMNKCTGCNACITACNVESNIPVVGKDEVLMGREMHWMRMDRYYSGTEDDVNVSIQPMLCQQCDNAPCENVCPVVATTHSDDGLNQMVYNRCVGTRYCANNCPYKVRRFNFYDFRDNLARGYYVAENGESFQYSDSMQHSFNPEVTVRSRGVMEKCDFCTSRIATARSLATKDKREFKGSDVVTACQEACPANAIYFGDSNDPESTVSKFRKHDLGYHVLDMLDVRPQVTYIAKLNNVVPEKEESHGNTH